MEIMYKQIYILSAIRGLRMFLIAMPIIVIYWQSHGLSIKDIFVLQVIFSIALVVFEIPTGYLADIYGKRKSVIGGSIAGSVGFLIYYLFPSYLGFATAEIVLALGTGLMSGARDALLHETLQEYKQEALYTRFEGRMFALGNLSEAIAAISAGIIATLVNIETVLLIQCLVIALTIPLSLSLKEVYIEHEFKTPTLLKIIKGNFKENKRLRYLNIYAGGLSAATLVMVWFAQPHWKLLGVDVLYFGYIWAGLNLLVGAGALLAHKATKRLSFRVLFGSMALAPICMYGLMAYVSTSLIALLVVPLFWMLRGISQPIIQSYVQRECSNNERATVLSINALVGRLIFSIFSPFVGWVADVWSFGTAFLMSGAIFGFITICSFGLLYSAMKKS